MLNGEPSFVRVAEPIEWGKKPKKIDFLKNFCYNIYRKLRDIKKAGRKNSTALWWPVGNETR